LPKILNQKCASCEVKISAHTKYGICRKCYLANYLKIPENIERKSKISKEWAKNNPEKHRLKSLNWQKNNPERCKEIRKKTISKPENRFRISKWRSKKRGVDWGISLNDYLTLISKNECSYCFDEIGSGTGLDRKDNDIGYITGNVVPCCGNCNLIKADRLSYGEMVVAMNAVLLYRESK
jgi:hypothetical protein